MKKCCTCKLIKDFSLFFAWKKSKDGRARACKSCYKTYTDGRKDKKKIYDKEYEVLNADRISERSKDYRQKNKVALQAKKTIYVNKKEKSDPLFKLVRRLRNRIYKVTKGIVKKGSSVKDLGCSPEEFKAHLESLFKPGMSWDNYSKDGWHVDHVIPLASFDLTNRAEFLKACNYTNLQPLWAEENLKKGKKVGI